MPFLFRPPTVVPWAEDDVAFVVELTREIVGALVVPWAEDVEEAAVIEVDENVDDVAIEVELVIADEGAPDVGAPDVGVAVVSADVQICGL